MSQAKEQILPTQGKKVIILGAGFGGMFAAMEFEKLLPLMPGTEVTLLDKNNYHMFVPLLFHVASGDVEPANICFPVRSAFRNGNSRPHVKFRECEVRSLDLPNKKVITDHGEIQYDYLIFALGSVTNYYGIPGLEQNIVPLKTIRDAIGLHNRILSSFEDAIQEPDEEKRRALLSFVIVGGGPTGVELSSAVAQFIYKTLSRDFPTLMPEVKVMLIEAGDSLLRGLRPVLGQLALKQLQKIGVEVILQCGVTHCTDSGIETKDGRSIHTRNVTWVAGVKPNALAQSITAEKARDGRIVVGPNLGVPSIPGLYVAGDSAFALQPGMATPTPYVPTAQNAIRMGIAAARNVSRAIMGHPEYPFEYKFKGELVCVGRNYAVGVLWGRVVSGVPAFFMYQAFHLKTLSGFRHRLGTFIDWAYDYFYRNNTTKLP